MNRTRKPKSNTAVLDRRPPASLEAEQKLLASLMIDLARIDDVAAIVLEEDFFDDANARLFSHVRRMFDEGLAAFDVTLLKERLLAVEEFEVVGGAAYLGQVLTSEITAAHAVHYAKVVREHSVRRQAVSAGSQMVADAFDVAVPAERMLDEAHGAISALSETTAVDPVSVDEVVRNGLEEIEKRKDGRAVTGVQTGFEDVDQFTCGFYPGHLVIIAARPSMGKTALVCNMVENIAVDQKRPALFFSLEMSQLELADRMLCSRARVNAHRVRNGTISPEERRKLVEAAGWISQAPLFIDDSPRRTIRQIISSSRRMKRKLGELSMVAIDYLQLIEPADPRQPRNEQVSELSRELKIAAGQLECPIVCLAQLNRRSEDNRDYRPKLSNIRDSGSVEQDADVVMFVHREEYYRTGDEQSAVTGQAEVIIAKNRMGPVGTAELIWRKEYTRFENKAPSRLDMFDEHNTREEQEELF